MLLREVPSPFRYVGTKRFMYARTLWSIPSTASCHLWCQTWRRQSQRRIAIHSRQSGVYFRVQNRKGSYLFLIMLEFGQGIKRLLIAVSIQYTDQQIFSISNRLIKRSTRFLNSLVFNLQHSTRTYTDSKRPHYNYIMDNFLNLKNCP